MLGFDFSQFAQSWKENTPISAISIINIILSIIKEKKELNSKFKGNTCSKCLSKRKTEFLNYYNDEICNINLILITLTFF